MKKIIFAVLAILLIAVGCNRTVNSSGYETVGSFAGTSVLKFKDGNVTCYVSDGHNSGGISCLVLP